MRKSRQDDPHETVEDVLYRHEIAIQEHAIRMLGHRIPQEYIFREVVSGETIESRPEIQKVMKLIEDPNCKGVFVYDTSRLTRGDLIDCGEILRAFKYTKTLVVTPQMTFDLDNTYDFKSLKSEFLRSSEYLEYTKENLQKGIHRSVADGYFVGSIAPYGYDRIKIGKRWTLAINQHEYEGYKLSVKMRIENKWGASKVGHELEKLGYYPRNGEHWRPTALRQMWANETYLGLITWNRKKTVTVYEDGKLVKKRPRAKDYERYPGKHPALIDQETFDQLQAVKNKVPKTKIDYNLLNPFSGLMKCKKCGYAIAIRRHRKNGVKIRPDRYYCRSEANCSCVSSNVDVVNEAIISSLKMNLVDLEVKAEKQKEDNMYEMHQAAIVGMQDELKKMEEKQEQLYDFLEDGIYTKEEYKLRSKKLNEEREDLIDRIKNAKQSLPKPIDYEEKIYKLSQALDALDDDSIDAKIKNELLKEIVEVIYYNKDKSDKTVKDGDHGANVELEIKLK